MQACLHTCILVCVCVQVRVHADVCHIKYLPASLFGLKIYQIAPKETVLFYTQRVNSVGFENNS